MSLGGALDFGVVKVYSSNGWHVDLSTIGHDKFEFGRGNLKMSGKCIKNRALFGLRQKANFVKNSAAPHF